ncbi:MAG TPA: TetR/AcrR family transcriptional regulator [Xanthomonadales bacterium]|nr:TetR/AcrR family transcriptional regulator [Xanthomonadales bacterium]
MAQIQSSTDTAADGTPDSRRRILHAALHLFHRNAFQAVGINAICAQAGVVKGSFYHFFPSKTALLAAVLEELSGQQRQMYEQAQERGETGRERIVAYIGIWLDQAEEQKAEYGQVLGSGLGVLAAELSCSDPEALTLIRSGLGEIQSQLRRLVRHGIEDGSIASSVEPVHTAYALLALLQGLSTLGRASNQPELMRETAQLAVRRILPVAYS